MGSSVNPPKPVSDLPAPATTEIVDVPRPEPHRGTIAEWTITIILLLFGTTTLVQAFVIPTGSMEDTLLIGDHLLVDKMAYAPAGPVSKYVLPYKPIKRGDIIVFRYPIDIRQTFVKRVIAFESPRNSSACATAITCGPNVSIARLKTYSISRTKSRKRSSMR